MNQELAVGQNQWYHFRVGEFTTHFRAYFSGEQDVHWGYGLFAHGQTSCKTGNDHGALFVSLIDLLVPSVARVFRILMYNTVAPSWSKRHRCNFSHGVTSTDVDLREQVAAMKTSAAERPASKTPRILQASKLPVNPSWVCQTVNDVGAIMGL